RVLQYEDLQTIRMSNQLPFLETLVGADIPAGLVRTARIIGDDMPGKLGIESQQLRRVDFLFRESKPFGDFKLIVPVRPRSDRMGGWTIALFGKNLEDLRQPGIIFRQLNRARPAGFAMTFASSI